MDGLQLLYLPSLNSLKIDQCKGSRGPVPPYASSVKSCSKKGFTGSNVRRRCQNKIASRASKLNELPENSCSQSCSPVLFSDSSSAVNSSDKYKSESKEDKSLKKNSRKRTRKKVRQSKKKSSDSGSPEQEVLAEEYVSASLASETCSSNDADKEVGLMYTTAPDFSSSDDRLIKTDYEKSEVNDSITAMEASSSFNSYLDEAVMSKASAPIVQSSAGDCATFESMNQLQAGGCDFAVIDREVKDIQHIDPCCFNDIQDSLVLDSVSISSKSDQSTNADDIGKRSNDISCRITSDSGDGYFLSQNLTNNVHNNSEHNEEIRHDGQSCISNDKRVKQKRTMSKSSSSNKFGGVGNLHGRTGKENSHSVWQKVQKNSSDECVGDLKKVNTSLSQFSSTMEKDPSVIRDSSSVSVNVVSKTEDKKQSKNKVGRKSKGKTSSVSKKGHCNYSRKGSHFNRSLLNGHGKVSVQQNDMLHISSQEINQQGLNTVSGFNSDINCLMDGVQTNGGVDQETSKIVHSAGFHPEKLNPQKNACHTIANMKDENIDIQDSLLVMQCENNQSDTSEEQSLVSSSLLGDEVGQTKKEESSADYIAPNHSSGSTLWKWIPIGRKNTGLEISESNSSSQEYSDAPTCNNFNLESSVEPKLASFSENQDSSLNASRKCISQINDKVSCPDEDENHKMGSQVACTLTEHKDKLEVANCMGDERENKDMLENESYRIAQAVNDVCRAQISCEAVHMATGFPVAEFEKLLHFCSPVICESLDSLGCSTCSHDHAGGVSLCRHEIPDLPLGCLWQWYEKHGSYGLEIWAQDCENLKRQGGVGYFPFRGYFVPSLSAVQLFKNHENQSLNSNDKIPYCEVSEACDMVDSENSSSGNQHSIFSVLIPQPRNQDAYIQTPKKMLSINDASNPPINSACPRGLELLFEYFEFEQPQQRRPLYEMIQELVRGNITIRSTTYGDPTMLDSVNLRDLHPRSWYSVAWYPIYRIPDGNFRAAFLTYHSLGHLVHRSTSSGFSTIDSCTVSPVVGLQSYNAQGECWFQLNHSALAAQGLGLNPSLVLQERLRTLEETASLMARAVVNKGNLNCTNRHPDYEFFLSRRRY
ncbi:uncharacterized protein LOC113867773 isoform X2 [Abrus precatorius]|nr:uncharacterized protein LOC113867773 isoform X2 [Abrus precatorius]